MANVDRVIYQVEEPEGERNRLTVGFRLILAIPHILLVGGPGIGIGTGTDRTGVLGIVAGVCAVINWFAILFTGKAIAGLTDLQVFYIRWRAKALAYMALLRDEYPPFGDGEYPVRAEFSLSEGERNRVSVGFRLFLLIPHAIVLFVLFIAWFVTAVISWFAILFTGRYPESLYGFGVGVMAYSLRVESYALLLHDDFPAFGPATGADTA